MLLPHCLNHVKHKLKSSWELEIKSMKTQWWPPRGKEFISFLMKDLRCCIFILFIFYYLLCPLPSPSRQIICYHFSLLPTYLYLLPIFDFELATAQERHAWPLEMRVNRETKLKQWMRTVVVICLWVNTWI